MTTKNVSSLRDEYRRTLSRLIKILELKDNLINFQFKIIVEAAKHMPPEEATKMLNKCSEQIDFLEEEIKSLS